MADHDQGHPLTELARRLALAVGACLAGSWLTSLAVRWTAAGELPLVGLHLVPGLAVAATVALAGGGARCERRLWMALWVVLPAVTLANHALDFVAVQAYGDYRWLQGSGAAEAVPARWVGGYALLRWIADVVSEDPAASFQGVVRATGILVTGGAALALHASARGGAPRLAVIVPTLTPVWLLFAAGHLEYYPLVAWAVPALLLWVLARPLAERRPLAVGAWTALLFPLLYVGYAPLALLLLGAYALAAPPRRWLAALGVAAAVGALGLALLYAPGPLAFLGDLPSQIARGNEDLFRGYRGLAAGPASALFAWHHVFSYIHLADLAFLQLVGGGWLPPLLLVAAALLLGRRGEGTVVAQLREPRVLFSLAALAAYAYYFLRMVPRLGPRDDLDLFFAFYLIVATLAGALLDRIFASEPEGRRRLAVISAGLGAASAGGFLLLVSGVRIPEPRRAFEGRELVGAHLASGDPAILGEIEEAVRRETISLEWFSADGAALGVGLTHDRWTLGEEAAGVWLRNHSAERRAPRLRLAAAPADASAEAPPVVVRLFSVAGRHEVELPARGSRAVALEPLAPGEARWLFLSASPPRRAPPPDGRWLGVNVRGVELAPVE